MTTTKNNKLVAEFMGLQPHKIEAFYSEIYQPEGLIQKPCYHNSWDWLMPVVEKIEFSHDGIYDVNILQDGTLIKDWTNGQVIISHTASDFNIPTKIEGVYQAVVQFIKWYNNQ